MLRTISWEDFGLTISLLLLLYYLFVIVVYFRAELRQLAFTVKQKLGLALIPAGRSNPVLPTAPAGSQPETDPLFPLTQHLVARLRSTITGAARQQQPQAELLLALQQDMQPYQLLKNTRYQSVITQLIEKETFLLCGVQWDAYDLASLWAAPNKDTDSSKPQ